MSFISRLLAVCLSVGTLTAHPMTYYVSSSGSDSNNGTSISTPWKTLAKVSSQAIIGFFPGDEIRFKGGETFTYELGTNLSIGPGKGGTEASPITFTSYGTGKATLVAANDKGFASILNTAGIKLTHLVIKGNGSTTNTQTGILFSVNIPNTRHAGITLDHVEIYGFGKIGLLIGGWAENAGFSQITLTNSEFHGNGVDGCNFFARSSFVHQNVIVRFCRFYNNTGEATNLNPTGSGLVLGSVDTGLVEFCSAYNNGVNNLQISGPIGIWTYRSRKVVIQHNVSYSNKSGNGDGGGFDIDGASEDCVIQYNYSYNNMGAGYLLAQYSGAPGAFHNNVIRYNISQNDAQSNKGYGGIMVWGGDGSNRLSNSQIYNNVVYVGNTSHPDSSALYVFGNGGYTGLVARNNIFITTGGRSVIRLVDYGNTGNLKLEGNNYYSSGASWQAKINSNTYATLAALRAAGQERIGSLDVGFAVDPRLVNAGGGGLIGDPTALPANLGAYKLSALSPLINAGLTPPTLTGTSGTPAGSAATTDFYGNAVPTSTHDVGIYEAPAPTGVQLFRAANDLAIDGSQDSLTPAGDGVKNLIKYAFNLLGSGVGQAPSLATPNTSVLAFNGDAGLPLIGVESGTENLQITYIRRKAAASPAPGITYAVEFSDALAMWAVNGDATATVTDLGATFERVTVTDSTQNPTPAKRFARIRITSL